MKHLTFIAASLLVAGTLSAQNIIPQPAETNLSGKTITGAQASALPIREKTDSSLPDEAYILKISPKAVDITASGKAGFFYARQSLAQEIESGTVNLGTIKDEPRYSWRGYMLDESRHFAGEARVKELLDMMAYFKLNKFHWHLTDAQGWRIEIKKYPRLTSIGARGDHSDPHREEAQYYTQDQIRDIVAYAAERNIEVIPEIDMPGHASAATRSYPQYSGGGVSATWPDFTFNVGKEETYQFLTDILREITGMFPSEYIHIGGDEVSYGSYAWMHNEDIVNMMKREGFTSTKQAENYFINRMADSLRVMGKTVIGWDDMLDLKDIPENLVLMWWRHDNAEHLRRAVKGNHTTILCPRRPMYFDFLQDGDHKTGRYWDGFCPIEDVYAFPDAWYEGWQLSEEDMGSVIGLQSNSWTELMHNKERFEYMLWPRLCATAEAGWTRPGNKDFQAFSKKLDYVYPVLDRRGIAYYDTRDPSRTPEVAGPAVKPYDNVILDNKNFRLVLNSDGTALSLISKLTDEELLAPGVKIPFCSITQYRPYDNENFLMFPAKPMTFPSNRITAKGDTLYVEFKDTYDIAVIKVDVQDNYMAFRLIDRDYRIEDVGVKRKTEIDEFALACLPIARKEHFGHWLNVSWDSSSACALIGSEPETRIDAYDKGTYMEMYAGGVADVGIIGTGAVLAVGPTETFLDIIDKVEEDFNMPRGVKSRRESTYPLSYYELRDATPQNIGDHIKYAKQGGFSTVVIYYPDFAWTCGHFLWNKKFANGLSDLQIITDAIREAGMIPGIHIHYSKVSTDDPYVQGCPDPRLGSIKDYVLAKDIKANDNVIHIDEKPVVARMEDGRRVVFIDNEAIAYQTVVKDGAYCFSGCTRGLFHTKPAAHKAGSKVRLPDLDDWPRFIRVDQNTTLQAEIADNLAKIINGCGFEFIYFDGAEDVPMPYWYNVTRAQKAVYDKLAAKPLYCEGALKSHYGWHILSRGNAFDIFKPEKIREGMRKYTLRGAAMAAEDFSSVNFGWVDYTAPTQESSGLTPDILEYICSKACAWRSPFSLMGHLETFDASPYTARNLEIVKLWEEYKAAGGPSEDLREAMKDPSREFALTKDAGGNFIVTEKQTEQ